MSEPRSVRSVPGPTGWRTAVALLRSGLKDRDVLAGVRREFDLDDAGGRRALAFAKAWLAEARATD
jgi:hypothetical protein